MGSLWEACGNGVEGYGKSILRMFKGCLMVCEEFGNGMGMVWEVCGKGVEMVWEGCEKGVGRV